MSHAYHGNLNGTVLKDGCDECEARVKLPGMSSLDDANLQRLAVLATRDHVIPLTTPEISHAEIVAIENLRLMGRIVFASGITEKVCR